MTSKRIKKIKIQKYYTKFNNVVTDFHWKTCNTLINLKPEVIILQN